MTETTRLALYFTTSFFIGYIINDIANCLLIGLMFYIGWHMQQIGKLKQWLDRSINAPPDTLTGIWEDIAYRIFHSRQRGRSRNKKLLTSLKRFQNSTSALPDAVVVLDHLGHIAWSNLSAHSLLGLKKSDNGTHIGNLIRDPKINQLLAKNKDAGILELTSPIDENKRLDFRLVPFATEGYLLLVRDITHVQRLMQMRQDFIANVSHELRTPLSVIIGYMENLENLEDLECMEPRLLHELLLKSQSQASRMKSIVEDLLILSRLDTEAIPLPTTCPIIPVPNLLQQIRHTMENLSAGKHQLVFDINEELQILGVEKELYSAFSNLATNAIRYSPDGGTIQVRWQLNKQGQAYFSVHDEGIGIAVEHIHRLTERFYRVDVGRSRTSGGTGLGLAIVKHVLQRHDAELLIDSEASVGSRFYCLFPTKRVVIVSLSTQMAS